MLPSVSPFALQPGDGREATSALDFLTEPSHHLCHFNIYLRPPGRLVHSRQTG